MKNLWTELELQNIKTIDIAKRCFRNHEELKKLIYSIEDTGELCEYEKEVCYRKLVDVLTKANNDFDSVSEYCNTELEKISELIGGLIE